MAGREHHGYFRLEDESRNATSVSASPPSEGEWKEKAEPRKEPISEWKIHWRKPASVIGLLVLGLACAFGHHKFYTIKDNTLATRQEWTIRIGTALAYLLGFSLASAMSISRDQWIWYNLRTVPYTLDSIDAMFGATSSVLCFFNWDMILRAKISTVMAAVKWLFPLLTLLTPSTISVVPGLVSARCFAPSLDFDYANENSSLANLDPVYIRDSDVNFLHFRNSNDSASYAGPSDIAKKLFTVPAFSGRITPSNITRPFGSEWKDKCKSTCNYTVQFDGPAITCTSLDPTSLPGYGTWGVYLSLCNRQATNLTLMPEFLANPTLPLNNSFWVLSTHPEGKDTYIACRKPDAFRCQGSVARYNVTQTIVSSQFVEPTIDSVKILRPFTSGRITSFSSLGDKSNQALYDTVIDILFGSYMRVYAPGERENSTITTGGGYRINRTRVGLTTLVQPNSGLTHDMGPAIEQMTHKMVVSLLSEPLLFSSTNQASICYSMQNTYHYQPFILLVTYTIAISVCGLLVPLGVIALMRNGVASDVSFSTILCTTRNPTLDRELKGACLGMVPLPTNFGKIEVQFGVLDYSSRGASGVGHVGMGVKEKDTISPIKKGMPYS